MAVNVKKNVSDLIELMFREIIENITINDDEWRCIVTMLIETSNNQTNFTTILNEACEKGYRKSICSLNRNKILDNFRTLPKSDKTDKAKSKSKSAATSTEKIRQCIGDILNSQEAINYPLPYHFEAVLIKWMIYEARLNYAERVAAEFEKQAEQEREFIEMQQPSVKAKEGTKHSRIKTTTEPRANSKLTRRDEEWKNRIYIDDAPEDGPNSYILLTGFYDPTLPMELIKIGVPLSYILRLENPQVSNDLKASRASSFEFEFLNSLASLQSLQSIKGNRYWIKCAENCLGIRTITNPESRNPVDFWSHFESSCCSEISVRGYCPPPFINDSHDLYDNISYVLYDFYDTMQDHARYLNSMKVYELCDPRQCEKRIMSSYNNFLSLIPEEFILIPIVLEAILRQVEENLEEEEEIKEALDRESGSNDELLTSSSPEQQESAKQPEVHAAATLSSPSASNSSSVTSSLSKVNSSTACAYERLTEKLGLLDRKYELVSQTNESSSREHLPDPELILHGDSLRLNACCADNEMKEERLVVGIGSELRSEPKSNFSKLGNFQVKLIEDPRISETWCQNNENEIRNCEVHLPGIFKYCQKQGLNQSRTIHILNITGLHKLLESYITSYDCLETDSINLNENVLSEKNFNKIDSNVKFNGHITSKNKENSRNLNNVRVQVRGRKKRERSISSKNSSSSCYCFLSTGSKSTGRESRQSLRYVKSSESFLNMSNSNSSNSSFIKSFNKNSSVADDYSIGNQLLRSFECCSDLFRLIDVHQNLRLSTLGKQCPILTKDFEDAELLSPNAFLQIVQDCFQEYEDEGFMAKYFEPTDSILLLFCDKPRKPNEITERHVKCVIRTPVCLRDFCDYVVDEESKWIQQQRKTRASNDLFGRYRSIQLDGREKITDEPVFKDEDFILCQSLKAADLELRRENENENEISDYDEQSRTASKQPSKTNNEKLSTFGTFSSSGAGEVGELVSPFTPPTYDFIGYDLGERRRVQVSNLSWTFESTDGMRVRLKRETWLLGSNKKQKTTSLRLTIPEEQNEGLRYHETELKDRFTNFFTLTMTSGIILAFSRLKNIAGPNELLYEIQISWPSGLIIKPVEYKDADFSFYILQYHSNKGLECKTIKAETHRKYLHNGDVVKFFNDYSIIVLRPNGTIITIMDFGNGDEKSMSNIEGSIDELKNARFAEDDSLFNQELMFESAYSCKELSLHYTVLELDGHHYEVCDGHIINELKRSRIRVSENYSNEEKFVQRDDGTDAIINSDGEMFVSFPDGTHVQSSCEVETELVHCEWSKEEVERYFGKDAPEGFISVVNYSRAEHPNYATVCCERPSLGVYGISMGKSGPRLQLKQHGFGELLINSKLRLEFDQNMVLLARDVCPCQGPTSTATFHLIDQPGTFGKSDALLTFQNNSNYLLVKHSGGGFSKIQGVETMNCNCQEVSGRKPRCRIFALDRNNQAHEYHHHAEWQTYEERISKDDRSSLIRSGNNWISLEVPKNMPDNSRDSPIYYEIPKAKPSTKYRIRSGDQDEDIWEKPFKTSQENSIQFLLARLIKNIVRPGEKTFNKLQKALVRYWREIATGVRETEDSEKSSELCACQEEIVGQMSDIALGKMKTINRKIYESGRQYINELKVKRDEDRTRETIDRSYFEKRSENEYPWLDSK